MNTPRGVSHIAGTIEAQLGPWTDRPGALHAKLAGALRDAVSNGHLVGGDRLPSERELAKRLAVSRSTVVTAYDTLRAEGLLESRQGSGTRVRPASVRSGSEALAGTRLATNPVYRSLMRDRSDIISLAAAVLPADPCVAEAFADFAANDADKLMTHRGYMPAGLPELRERIAEHLTKDGVPTTLDQVLVTTGAQQAVNLAALMFVQPGDDVVVESPSFIGTIDAFRTRGAQFSTVPVDDDGVHVHLVRARIAARRPSAVYLMPSYHNPTGAQLSESRRRALAELATSDRIPIIEDNALEYSPLEGSGHLRPIAAFAGPDVPVLSAASLSKAAWGGLRIGWLRGPAPLIGRLAELKAMTDLGSPLIDQAVAARIVPQMNELRERHRVTLQRHLNVMAELLTGQLPDWRWKVPRGGPSLWVQLPYGNAAAFAQVAERHGVEVIPGEVMSPDSGHEDFLRLPFTQEPPVLEETVRRLNAAWSVYARREEPSSSHRTVVV